MNNEPNISLYGDGTGEDFPVLKAFQQYIDAEQAKARRRLLTVSVMFVVIILAVIAIFSTLVIRANNQTQALNDRLVEFAMNNPARNFENAKAAAIQELTVKSLNESVAKLQKQIEEQDRKAAAAAAKAAKDLAAARQSANAKSDPVADKRTLETEAKLQRALSQLKVEKQKLADEKEKIRQEELDKYRREHYPEFYAKREAATQKLKARKLSDRITNILDDISSLDEDGESIDDDEDYDLDLSDDDSYTIPVEVKGKNSSWRIPLD